MARTNTDIDDEAYAAVVRQYELRTRQDAANLGLRMAASRPMSLEEALAMQGSGWEGRLGSDAHHPLSVISPDTQA